MGQAVGTGNGRCSGCKGKEGTDRLPECLKEMHNKVVRVLVHWSPLSSALLVPQHF